MNDGAAAVVLMSSEKAKELGIRPLAIIHGYADAEQEPVQFTTTPSIALPVAVKRAGLQMTDIDFVELNEAFSVVGIVNTKRMNLDPAKVNVHGGAVSIGHPLGCSGARIIVTLINVLNQNNGKYGAAGICNGGGGASACVCFDVGFTPRGSVFTRRRLSEPVLGIGGLRPTCGICYVGRWNESQAQIAARAARGRRAGRCDQKCARHGAVRTWAPSVCVVEVGSVEGHGLSSLHADSSRFTIGEFGCLRRNRSASPRPRAVWPERQWAIATVA